MRIHDILWPIIILRPTIILLFLYISYPCLNSPVIRQPIRGGVYLETNLHQYHICTFYHLAHKWHGYLKSTSIRWVFIVKINCWWPVDAKNPGISSHSGLSTRRVNGCFTQNAGMFVQALASWYAHGVLQHDIWDHENGANLDPHLRLTDHHRLHTAGYTKKKMADFT